MDKLLKKVNEYTDLVIYLQKKGVFLSDFSKGYYVSKHKKARVFEEYFISNVPKIINEIKKEIITTRNNKQIALYLHLLGWSKDFKSAPDFLMKYILDKNVAISNASMRSLFPMVASGKYYIDVRLLNNLIHKRSTYVKNKALGLIAFSSVKSIKGKIDKEYIYLLSKHKSPMVSEPAKLVLKKLQ